MQPNLQNGVTIAEGCPSTCANGYKIDNTVCPLMGRDATDAILQVYY
jgi:hypothetical protein